MSCFQYDDPMNIPFDCCLEADAECDKPEPVLVRAVALTPEWRSLCIDAWGEAELYSDNFVEGNDVLDVFKRFYFPLRHTMHQFARPRQLTKQEIDCLSKLMQFDIKIPRRQLASGQNSRLEELLSVSGGFHKQEILEFALKCVANTESMHDASNHAKGKSGSIHKPSR
jgi:hypothetical protein